MHPKIKNRPVGVRAPINGAKPLLLHDVTNQLASANAASRLRLSATQPASRRALHARHHVARQTQA